MSDIRVRFAPSPTGPLHIGGLRTALFNYLFARKHKGQFILRIEDTDQNRFIPGAEDYILEALNWCGLNPDEGVGKGGEYGPYRQSERKEMYHEFAEKLLEAGHAYYAFDTPEQLNNIRKEHEARKETFTYDASTREQLSNSIAFPAQETEQWLSSGKPYVIRFKFEKDQTVEMNDLIRGQVKVNSSSLDDKILFKSDGMPTYHLANVVDDYHMKISHVIRGEEWLPSLPLHVSMYKAFGWEAHMPEFAHLPLILKPDGKGKLSKRDGDKGGFPVFPLEWKDPVSGEMSSGYREAGYFPEACVNIFAFLGWNPGSEKELYSLQELITDFDLSKVGKAGAKFDPDKARWYNHQYLQKESDIALSAQFKTILNEKNVSADDAKIKVVVKLIKERVNFVAEMWDQSYFFFEAPVAFDEQVVKKRWKENSPELMTELIEVLKSIDIFNAANIESKVKAEIEAREWGMGVVMNGWRLLLVGTSMGPGMFDLAEILGKEEVIKRMNYGILNLK
ncbi:glutamate--tRNA ligase [Bacteroidota bacterium]